MSAGKLLPAIGPLLPQPASVNYISLSRADQLTAAAWSLSNATQTPSYTGYGNVYSDRPTLITFTSVSGTKFAQWVESKNVLPIGTYVISAWIKHLDSTLGPVSVTMPQGTNITTVASDGNPATGWQRIYQVFKTTTSHGINTWGNRLSVPNAQAGAIVFDDWMVEPLATGQNAPTAYFDGSFGVNCSWTGTPFASISVRAATPLVVESTPRQVVRPIGGLRLDRAAALASTPASPYQAGIGFSQGINVKNAPYNARGNYGTGAATVVDDTAAFRAAISAAMPSQVNVATALATPVYASSISVSGGTATWTSPTPLPNCCVVGASVTLTGFVPSGLNGTHSITAVSNPSGGPYTFQFASGSTTMTAHGTSAVISSGTVASAVLSGTTLTITMTNNLPTWFVGANPNAPTLDPGTAVQLLGTWTDSNGVNFANTSTGLGTGTWYTAQTVSGTPGAPGTSFTITVQSGLVGPIAAGTIQAWGTLLIPGSDSGVVCTPVKRFVTSTSTEASVSSPVIVPAGNYAIQQQPQDPPGTTILPTCNIDWIGAGVGMSVITVLAPPSTGITQTAAGVAAIATASGSGSSVTISIATGGSGYVYPPRARLFTTGGGTYTSITTTISGGAVTGATVVGASGFSGTLSVIIDPPYDYEMGFGVPAVDSYNTSAYASTVHLRGFTLQYVTPIPYGELAQAAHVRWALCDGLRLNNGQFVDHVMVTGFDANLVMNSFGGSLQLSDCLITNGYYNIYTFMDGGNDAISNVNVQGAGLACFAYHANTQPQATGRAGPWESGCIQIFQRIYGGTAPIGMLAGKGFTPTTGQQYWMGEAEFIEFGFEACALAGIYSVDAALGTAGAGLVQTPAFRTPYVCNFSGQPAMANGNLPQLEHDGLTDHTQRYLNIIGGVAWYMLVDHSWGFSSLNNMDSSGTVLNNAICWHINEIGASGEHGHITCRTSAQVDATKLFKIDSDTTANGAVRIEQVGCSNQGSSKFPKSVAIAPVSISTSANSVYVQNTPVTLTPTGITTSTTGSVTTATFTNNTTLPAAVVVGASVVLAGFTPSGLNGTFPIVSVNTGANQITFVVPLSTGTMTVAGTTALIVNWGRVSLTQTSDPGLQHAYRLIASPLGSVVSIGGLPGSDTFTVTLLYDAADPGLVSGQLPNDLTFNWEVH